MNGRSSLIVCSPQIGIDPESDLGGAVADREHLKALARLGVRVIIPLPAGERHDDVANWEIIRTRRHLWKYYEYNLIFRRAVARLLAEGRRIDILRAHAAYSTGPGLLTLARRRSIPCHLHYHHWEPGRLRGWIERLTFRRYSLITTDSDYTRRQLIERLSLTNRIEVLYPGVKPEYQPGPVSPDLMARYGRRKVLLSVGVLVARKNIGFLLRVLRQLRDSGRADLTLLVLGAGPLEGALRRQARELGIDTAVEFAGRVNEARKIEYYRLCDVFVFPSLLEGFGMAPAEAMACGKPVVASRVTSLSEVIDDGRTGFLADPADERDFVEKIARLLDSPPLRDEMGREGRRRVAERFDWMRSGQRLLGMYEELVP
jgi:glycosyltransferase involved in cell wall biosynthesis